MHIQYDMYVMLEFSLDWVYHFVKKKNSRSNIRLVATMLAT